MSRTRSLGWIAVAGLIIAACNADDVEVEVPSDAGLAQPGLKDDLGLLPRDFDPQRAFAVVSDTLPQYTAKCDAAIGVTVPDFQCDAGTLVPTTNFVNGHCDQPNRLNRQCDPGSRLQVLANTAAAYVVAHCRKQGLGAFYGDIAVIQHNKQNGATCFYQALVDVSGPLDGNVKAPSKGSSVWPWISPAGTASIRCVRCHDNGPLIRSPYLSQVTGVNRLPGAGDPAFNRDQPYGFIGADFGAWRAFKVEVAGNSCNGCHRMGTSTMYFDDEGTGLDLGIRATAPSEIAKNPHSATSPIWMLPGQVSYNPTTAIAAQEIRNCAARRNETPRPSSSTCTITPFTTAPAVFDTLQVFGGNFVAEDFYRATQDTCSPGYARSGIPEVEWFSNAGGYCAFDRWVSPDDLNDCRAIIHSHTGGGGFGGTCRIRISQVPKPGATNLARSRPASQSSTAESGDPQRAVDGNSDGNFWNSSVTHTAVQAQAWWQVDLGSVTELGEIVLYNRTDCCGDRLADFDVLVSSDGVNWLTAATFGGAATARTALALRTAGRYVRVQLRGANVLSLAEVELYAPQNLAAFKRATQSSTFSTGAATNAIDSNTDGDWNHGSVTHTNPEVQPWWQVDLGAVTDIGQVVLYNRTDCCGERLADFDILVSSDGINWQVATSFVGPAGTRLARSMHAAGRFVRVRLRGTNSLSLAEVQVFAPQNVAASKTASQSSTAWSGDAGRAVDGNPDGNWANHSVTHTAVEAQPWWQVDLGAVAGISDVVLYNRTDCCGERLANFDIQVSNDGFTWTLAVGYIGLTTTRTRMVLNRSARFVRVRLRNTDALSLAEVRVHSQ